MSALLIFLLITASSQATRYLISEKRFPSVRASGLVTLFFVLLIALTRLPENLLLEASVLGGSLLGMTDEKRLSKKALLMSSVVYSFFFHFLLPLNPGFGGALGVLAFAASTLCWSLLAALGQKGSTKFFLK